MDYSLHRCVLECIVVWLPRWFAISEENGDEMYRKVNDVDKVQDTRMFPKSRHLPMPPLQSPQLLKKLVVWQEMTT